jgi:tRNA (guanine-N7-)-methyltransferase
MKTKTKKDLKIPYTWDERRPVFLDRMFYIPKVYDHTGQNQLNWADLAIFGNKNPVCMEICSGNGQWIRDRAIAQPEKNWVAVEMCFERARSIWLKIHREKIPNLYVICAEATAFVNHYVQMQSIEQGFVNFPDPWPKRCHAKHRLIWAPFVQSLQKVIQNQMTLATDDETYYLQMVAEFTKAGGWKKLLFEPSDEVYGDSFFADLWKQKGKTIFYLQYINGNR